MPDSALGGQTLNGLPHNPYATATHRLVAAFTRRANSTPDNVEFLPSNNFLVLASLFRAIGGFHVAFRYAAGEDREFCARWRQRGYRLRYVPKAIVCHQQALTGREFWHKHFTYGRGAYGFHTAYTAGSLPRPRHPTWYTTLQLLYDALPRRGDPRYCMVTILLALSQLATLAGVAWEWGAYRCATSLHHTPTPLVRAEHLETATRPFALHSSGLEDERHP